MYRFAYVLGALSYIPSPRILSKDCPGCGVMWHFSLLLSVSRHFSHPLKQGRGSYLTL